MKTQNRKKLSRNTKEKLSKARKNFEKIQRNIAPFIKVKKQVTHSTTGKWKQASHSYDFML